MANDLVKQIKHEISSLDMMPERFKRVDLKGKKYENIRYMVVKKYLIVYKIYKEYKKVEILRLIYSSRDLKNIL